MATTTFVDYYQILEVDRRASTEKIKEAISLQRRTWVKRQQAPSKERQREAEDRVRAIDDAQKTLLDPAKRSQYDAQLNTYQAPTASAGAGGDSSTDWLSRAKDFLARNDPHSAAYCAKQATEHQGNNHEAWAVRAHASFLIGQEQDAVFEFNEAIRIKPDAPDYHFDLGSLYESRSNWKAAMSCYERASTLAPGEPLYRVAIASVFLNNDVPDKALQIMELVHAEFPEVEAFNAYYVWALHGYALQHNTLLKSGDFIITRPEQIAQTREILGRAKGLKYDDPELRAAMERSLKLADDAEKLKFHFPGWGVATSLGSLAASPGCMTVFIAFLIFCIPFFIAMPVSSQNAPLGVVIIIAEYAAILKYLCFKPQWKLDDKATKGLQVSRPAPPSIPWASKPRTATAQAAPAPTYAEPVATAPAYAEPAYAEPPDLDLTQPDVTQAATEHAQTAQAGTAFDGDISGWT